MREGRPAEELYAAALCQSLARLIKTCSASDPARRFLDFGAVRQALAGVARSHLGLELNTGESPSKGPSASADLLNQGLALLWLGPGKQDAASAVQLLLQATLQSPHDPIAAGFSRRFLNRLNSRQLLRFAWRHARSGARTLRWWLWLLAAAAAFAVLLYRSPETPLVKVSDAVLALALGVEAYVEFLSARTPHLFSLAMVGICAALYAIRWVWSPEPLSWDHELASLLGALGVWACFVGLHILFQFLRLGKFSLRGLPTGSFTSLLPVLLFLGGPRALFFGAVFLFVAMPLCSYLSCFLGLWQEERFLKRGISLGQLQYQDLGNVLLSYGPLILGSTIIAMLGGKRLMAALILTEILVISIGKRLDRRRS